MPETMIDLDALRRELSDKPAGTGDLLGLTIEGARLVMRPTAKVGKPPAPPAAP